MTATVTAVSGTGTPTGTVTFEDGSTVLSTVTLSGDTATFSTSTLTPGSHDITAVYDGEGSFLTSTSSVVDLQITNSTTALTSTVNPAVFGQSITFTAAVTSLTGTGTPTGTVDFEDGTTLLGTGTLNNGTATFSTSALSVGSSHSITAVYLGDSTFSTSTSAALSQVSMRPARPPS